MVSQSAIANVKQAGLEDIFWAVGKNEKVDSKIPLPSETTNRLRYWNPDTDESKPGAKNWIQTKLISQAKDEFFGRLLSTPDLNPEKLVNIANDTKNTLKGRFDQMASASGEDQLESAEALGKRLAAVEKQLERTKNVYDHSCLN